MESLDSTSTGEDKDDTDAYTSFSSYWQRRFNAQTGLRADYNLYADFHHEFDDNDVIEQLFSIEPQWFHDQMIFSLPLQYTYGIEDNDAKYHRFAIIHTHSNLHFAHAEIKFQDLYHLSPRMPITCLYYYK